MHKDKYLEIHNSLIQSEKAIAKSWRLTICHESIAIISYKTVPFP